MNTLTRTNNNGRRDFPDLDELLTNFENLDPRKNNPGLSVRSVAVDWFDVAPRGDEPDGVFALDEADAYSFPEPVERYIHNTLRPKARLLAASLARIFGVVHNA
ncbi:MAG: hypothetical protein FWG82_01365 [Oscillospiraceae bacterium]|nr:hypothetical protein [Oscillospiraceae bacterium]